jgi:hypothetical protein
MSVFRGVITDVKTGVSINCLFCATLSVTRTVNPYFPYLLNKSALTVCNSEVINPSAVTLGPDNLKRVQKKQRDTEQ